MDGLDGAETETVHCAVLLWALAGLGIGTGIGTGIDFRVLDLAKMNGMATRRGSRFIRHQLIDVKR